MGEQKAAAPAMFCIIITLEKVPVCIASMGELLATAPALQTPTTSLEKSHLRAVSVVKFQLPYSFFF